MYDIKESLKIEDMIYEIRGVQVMLDRDLAILYNVETRILNQKVKRNIERFPKSFCFQMKDDEFIIWKSQIVMSKNDRLGLRRPPYVFTEQGVAMLSAILKSDVAIKTSIEIMDAFAKMRKYISNNLLKQEYINNMVLKHDSDINILKSAFNKFKPKDNEIFFNGQIYDAYSKIADILNEAKINLIIIDSYADKSILDMISNINVDVTLITKEFSLLKNIDIEKYNKQYSNLRVVYNNTFHDRYIIIDEKMIYHCGASINHAGNKTFSINLLEDEFIVNSLINNIKNHVNT